MTLLRVVDELLWMLRRAGFTIATSQAIDAVRVIRAVGFESRERMRDALAAVVVKRARDRARFDTTFDAYFARTPMRTLWERLEAQGFSEDERDVLREILDTYATSSPEGNLLSLLHRGADLDRLLQLAGSARTLDALQSPLQSGFYTHRLLEEVGTWRSQKELEALRAQLADALGTERADAIVLALKKELELAADDVRSFVKETLVSRERESEPKDIQSTPFSSLDDAEVEEVRRSVRSFVQRLRGGERVRRRRARHGRIDPHRTLRLALRTSGVPLVLARRVRKRDKPKLLVLCDVSESVRGVARFLLEMAYASQELFSGTRTFVFVSDLGETTKLFATEPIEVALSRAWSGAVVPVTHNSNYGRVLRSFESSVLADVDRRTTVVILGDGRTNYLDNAAEVLDEIRARARAVVWLCPESRAQWATCDSAMPRYAPKCTSVLEVQNARDLEAAARLMLSLR